MKPGREGRAPEPDEEVVGADVRELLAADDERAPADLHAVVAAMAREAQGLPQPASVPTGALPRWQRLVPIAAVLVLSVGVVPLVVREAPTEPRSDAMEPAAGVVGDAPVGEVAPSREAEAMADADAPEAFVAADEPAPARSAPEDARTAESFDVPVPAPASTSASATAAAPARDGVSERLSRARSSDPGARSPDVDAASAPERPRGFPQAIETPRDGARRVVELLRTEGIDAALRSYAAWRARWPEADLAALAGDASDDELGRLRDAVASRTLPPLAPVR